jgi:hypothetical protein
MWEPQPLATLRASTAGTRITLIQRQYILQLKQGGYNLMIIIIIIIIIAFLVPLISYYLSKTWLNELYYNNNLFPDIYISLRSDRMHY